MDNRLYMACLDLRDARALVVGSDAIALEKAQGLLASGASVVVVSPEEPHEGLLELGVEVRPYMRSDLDGMLLVVVATEDMELARAIHADAVERPMLVNVADVPELCNFILPSIHREGTIAIAVSTGGASPALGQRIRDEIASTFGPPFATLAEELRRLRPWAKEHLPTYAQRRDLFRSVARGVPDPIELISAGDMDGFEALVEERKAQAFGD